MKACGTLFLACALAMAGCRSEAEAPRVRTADIPLPREIETVAKTIERGMTLSQVLRAHGVAPDWAEAAAASIASVYDARRFRSGNPFRLVRTLDGALREFQYHIDSDSFLRVVRDATTAAVTAMVVPYVKQRQIAAVRGQIPNGGSLVGAMSLAGERIDLALALADIFGGEIDFNNDLQSGDRFELLIERYTVDGAFSSYGAISAASITTGGRTLQAFRFAVADGQAAYYDERGRSLKRFFLRSPLKFEPRITSSFSRHRLHPVLHKVRAHLGVDYEAPAGAPVVAAASGVVVSAANHGGAGRMVHLRHPDGYETQYLHLSSFSVRAGQRVGQGDVIGRVGSTGLATAAHLDYRIRKNGVFINPVALHRKLPSVESIPAHRLEAFFASRDAILAQLGRPDVQHASLAPPATAGMSGPQ